VTSLLHSAPSKLKTFFGVLWAIGLRLPHATEAGVKQAIADRTIIRRWPMRGTLHFVAAADVRWMLELLAPRVVASSAGRYRQLELNTAIFLRGEKAFIKALQGGVALTRDQMYEQLERSRISTAGQRGIHILSRLAQEGLICFGAHAGKQPTFVLLDEWAPRARKLARDEALAELARRYFTSRGPAALHDFAWWSGLKVSDAKAGLEMVSSRLVQETLGGSVYWMLQDQRATPDATAEVNLLPSFDEYLLAYKDRSASLDPRDAPKILPGKGGFAHDRDKRPRRRHLEAHVQEKRSRHQHKLLHFTKNAENSCPGRRSGALQSISRRAP
jgi:hypothetical protein